MLLTVLEEIARLPLVTYGMYSFTFVGNMASWYLCMVGYVSFVVMSQLYFVYEVDIDILAHFKIKFCATIMVMFSLHY